MSYLKIMQEKVVISLQHILDCDVQNPLNKMEALPTSVLPSGEHTKSYWKWP